MRVIVDGQVREGAAVTVDLSGSDVTPEGVRAAVAGTASSSLVSVEAPDPGPAFEYVGHVGPDTDPPVRAALAAAARSRGDVPPQQPAVAAARETLESLDVPASPTEADLGTARERVAEARAAEDSLHEQVAALRGRVAARREVGADVAGVVEDLRAAAGDLSAAETERVAAQQRLDRLRRRAREARDIRRRRLRLQDRLANLEREARAWLADRVHSEFCVALSSLPGEATPGESPGTVDGDPVTAALAVVRVADTSAPVVLSADRFGDAASARRRLDAAVLRVRT